MRIAFYGGSFDPPHRGHLAVAHAAIARLALDRVLMAPAGIQPLKESNGHASFEDRLAMVRLAVEDDPRLTASDVDAPRADGHPNYTLDTLESLERGLPGADKLFCLLGADSLFSINKWHRSAELLLFCDFIVAGRPGFSFDEIAALLPAGIRQAGCERRPGSIRIAIAGPNGQSSALYLLPGVDEDVSASDIRAALAGGSEMQTVLSAPVADYIRAHALYGARSNLQSRAQPEVPRPA